MWRGWDSALDLSLVNPTELAIGLVRGVAQLRIALMSDVNEQLDDESLAMLTAAEEPEATAL